MELSGGDLLKIIITIGSVTYSVVFGLVAKKVWDVPKLVADRLVQHEQKFQERLNRIDDEAKLAHRRINVHDRISSKLADKDFDSRAIAESGLFPDIRKLKDV